MAEKLDPVSGTPYHIVLQAYGHEGILQECLFVLFSFTKMHPPEAYDQVVFHIYTDQPEWFRKFKDCPLQVVYHELTPAVIQKWRGETGFVHRVKIEVLRDFTSREQGAVLYLDTDVYFTTPLLTLLERISRGTLYMHVAEGRLNSGANPMMGKLHRFFRKKDTFRIGDNDVTIPADAIMWNAGVLGFHTGNAGMLDEVLAFTDIVHPQFPKHIVEQFAFSWFMGTKGAIHNSANSIVHYWILSEVKLVLASWFRYFEGRSWEDLVRFSGLVQHTVLVQEKTSFFINRSVSGKIRQLRWAPVIPDWNALSQQM